MNLEVSAVRDSAYYMTGTLSRTFNTMVIASELKELALKRDHRQLNKQLVGFLDTYLVSKRDVETWKRDIAEGLA